MGRGVLGDPLSMFGKRRDKNGTPEGIPSKSDLLIWTGPRATDIIDCENGLFDGSITLYGYEREMREDLKPSPYDTYKHNRSFERFFCQASKRYMSDRSPEDKTDGESESDASKATDDPLSVLTDENGRIYTPNHCFCNSEYNLGGKGFQINHNRPDLEEGDLYILVEQIILMDMCNNMKGNQSYDVHFMSYNQNFVGRHGTEDQYLLLASLIVCTRDNSIGDCIRYIHELHSAMESGDAESLKDLMNKSFDYLRIEMEKIKPEPTDENLKHDKYDGEYPPKDKTQTVRLKGHTSSGTCTSKILGNKYNKAAFEEFEKAWSVDREPSREYAETLMDIFCDVLGFFIKNNGFKKDLDAIRDPNRHDFVDNILRTWTNALTFDKLCKIALISHKLMNEEYEERKITSVDSTIHNLIHNHLEECKDQNVLKNDSNPDMTINVVWMMKFLSEIIVTHMVCLNRNEKLVNKLDSKEGFRGFCKTHEIPTTENIIIRENGEDCSLNVFNNYIRCDKFVIQKNHSSGGFGTYLYEKPKPIDNGAIITGEGKDMSNLVPGSTDAAVLDDIITERRVDEKISKDLRGCTKGDLILSKYRDPSVSINIHCMIGEREILYSPGSIQIVVNMDGRLMYSGADFIAFQRYKEEQGSRVSEIMEYLSWMCGSLRGYGYRGIIGFDILVSDEHGVEFVEANDRFQASTCMINKTMRNLMFDMAENGHINRRYDQKPISDNYRFPSMQLLNLMCFKGEDYVPFDGESRKGEILEKHRVAYHELIRRYAQRFCPECIDNSHEDNILARLPVLKSEFENISIPYSMFIFYNGDSLPTSKGGLQEQTDISGHEHFESFYSCMTDIQRDEDESYIRRLRKVNNDVVVKVGKYLHSSKQQDCEDYSIMNNIQRRSHILDDGITNRYYQDAIKSFKEISGALVTNQIDSIVLVKCNEILDSLPALLYSDFYPSCDEICLLCDLIHYYKETIRTKTVQKERFQSFIENENKHWQAFYEERKNLLRKLLQPIKHNNNTIRDVVEVYYEDNQPIGVMELREKSTRTFLGIISRYANEWSRSISYDINRFTNDKGNMEAFNEHLDFILEIIMQKEIEMTQISKIRMEKFCKKLIDLIEKNKNPINCIAPNSEESCKDAGKHKGGSEQISKQNKTDAERLKIIRDAYEIITKNPIHRNDLCRIFDGEDRNTHTEFDQDAFISKAMFYTNICSTNLGKVIVHPNILPPERTWNKRILSKDGAEYLALKISLINNGIRLDENMKRRFHARPGVNSSVDLLIKCKKYRDYGVLHDITEEDDWNNIGQGKDGDEKCHYNERTVLPINCAYNNKIAIFSPFKLEEKLPDNSIGDKYFTISYYGKPIMVYTSDGVSILEIGFYHDKDGIKGLTDTNRIPKSSIAFLATDRVRFQHNDGCIFASKGRGCKFCEFTVGKKDNRTISFDENDILEVVRETIWKRHDHDEYQYIWSNKREKKVDDESKWCFDHVLIGGGTLDTEGTVARDRIKTIAEEINKTEKMRAEKAGKDFKPLNMYLMCVPPDNLDDLYVWHKAGITEIAFNMEVCSRNIAQRIMPGKSRISRSTYYSALIRAVHIWNRKGAVRSALILGLETESSTMEGVSLLTSIGVEPILSIFRPVEGTELSYVMPLSSPILHEIYREAQTICERASLRLGPDCIHCQNNTLSLPKTLDYERRNADGEL